ncbi:MAG: serine hydrolase domain-containing protein, partial [Parvularculaceae bacterium]
MAATEDFPISGLADAPFARVRDAFAQNFAEGLELGARFSVFVEGACVIDLIGGFADRERYEPWADGTLAGLYSSGKLVVALLIARAASEGRLDYDAPVANYWPAFAANGKEGVLVRHLMSHTSGVSAWAQPVEVSD